MVRRRELQPQAGELGRVGGLEVVRVDPVRDHRDLLVGDREDVGDLLPHVVGAGDHPVGTVGDPALNAVDMRLRVLVHPTLVAAVLGGVDGGHQGRPEPPRQVVAGHRHEPVVAVHQVELVAIPELHAGGQHVGVHPLHPGHELAEVELAGSGSRTRCDGDARRLLVGGDSSPRVST